MRGASASASQMEASATKAGQSMSRAGTSGRDAMSGFGQSMSPVMGTMGSVTAGAVGLGVAIGGLVTSGVMWAAQAEQAEIAFTSFFAKTSSGEEEANAKAKDFIKTLQEFSAVTPFEFPQLREAASALMAVGVSAEEIVPILKGVGDAVASVGKGPEAIQRATVALQQMAQKGNVAGEEMMQLTEAGIPAWDALAAHMNTTVADAQEKVTKRQVKANEMFAAIEDYAGPAMQRVKGMMDKQSASLLGLWSTFKDRVGMILGNAAMPLVEALKNALPTITEFIASLAGVFAPVLQMVGTLAATLGVTLAGAMVVLGPALDVVAKALQWIADVVSAVPGPVLAVVGAFIAFERYGGVVTTTALNVQRSLVGMVAGFSAANAATLAGNAAMAGSVVVLGLLAMRLQDNKTKAKSYADSVIDENKSHQENIDALRARKAQLEAMQGPSQDFLMFHVYATEAGRRHADELDAVNGKLKEYQTEAEKATGLTGDAAVAAQDAKEKWDKHKESIEGNARALKELEEREMAAASPLYAYYEAVQKNKVAQDTLTILQKQGKTGTAEYQQALLDASKAALELDVKQRNLATSTATNGAEWDTFKETLRRVMEQQGWNKTIIDQTIWSMEMMRQKSKADYGIDVPVNVHLMTVDELGKWFTNLLHGGELPPPLSVIIGGRPNLGGRNNLLGAAGGPVRAGMPYIVGEKGPEWFVPKVGGAIAPTWDQMVRGGGGTTVNVTVHTQSTVDRRQLADAVTVGVRSALDGVTAEVATERRTRSAR